jgi:hypothetical protein
MSTFVPIEFQEPLLSRAYRKKTPAKNCPFLTIFDQITKKSLKKQKKPPFFSPFTPSIKFNK